jgi:polysaccharide biosynthesis protein PslH
MSRILYIGIGTPWTAAAGYLLRQRMFLYALAELGDLEVALIGHCEDAKPDPAGWRVHSLVAPPRRVHGRLPLLVHDLFSRLPRWIWRRDGTAVREQVRALRPQDYDAVFTYRIDAAALAGVLGHPRLLLDVDDPEHLRQARALALQKSKADWRTARDLQKLRAFELGAVAAAAAAFFCHSADAAAFPRGNLFVVPNCVDVPAVPPVRQPRAGRLVFVGDFSGGTASPNRDALNWFVREIWPLILHERPDSELHLAGRGSSQLPVNGSVNVCGRGFVDDLSELYSSASVCIAPIRFGTGTRIKILEAMAHGCPVVSTNAGAAGLNLENRRNILLAAGEREFAGCCLQLLQNPGEQRRLGEAGYEVVRDEYDRAAQHPGLVIRLREIMQSLRGDAAAVVPGASSV